MAEIRACESCKRKFEVIVAGGGMSSPEPEPLKCPHCGFTRLELTSGRFVTRPVRDEDAMNASADTPPIKR